MPCLRWLKLLWRIAGEIDGVDGCLLSCRTPAMAMKELRVYLLAYNLVRASCFALLNMPALHHAS